VGGKGPYLRDRGPLPLAQTLHARRERGDFVRPPLRRFLPHAVAQPEFLAVLAVAVADAWGARHSWRGG